MKPQICRNDSHIGFLEPPHTHNPSSVSKIANLSSSLLKDLSEDIQSALANLQESTSIAFASFTRLQELFEERFDRLMPSTDVDGSLTFSESSFFNFVNALRAERSYLLEDALPDWRHKSSLARAILHPYLSPSASHGFHVTDAAITISSWWQCLQTTVLSWSDEVQMSKVPDYEDTIDEYLALYEHDQPCSLESDETPINTPDEAPTPTLDARLGDLQLSNVKMRDFAVSVLPSKARVGSVTVSELPRTMVATRLADTAAEEFLLQDKGKPREKRNDSGISMVD